MNAKVIAVIITVLAAALGAHFAVLLLSVAMTAVMVTLAVLSERIVAVVARTGWRLFRVAEL